MLRIIHTGRAYEVLDLPSPVYCLTDCGLQGSMFWLHRLREKYAALKTRYWQYGFEIRRLRILLGNTEQKLRAKDDTITTLVAEYDQLEKAFDAGWGPELLRAQRAEAETEQLRRLLHDERARRDEWKRKYHQAVTLELKLCQKSTQT